MHMLPYDDDDKEDRWEKLPAAVLPSDYKEMGEGEEVKARWNRWATPKGDEDDSGEEHAGLQWQVWPEPIRPVGDKPIGLHVIVSLLWPLHHHHHHVCLSQEDKEEVRHHAGPASALSPSGPGRLPGWSLQTVDKPGNRPVRSGIGKALAAEESNTLHRPVCYHFLQQ